MTTRVALVRHGATEWNRLRLLQGRADNPIHAIGREQAQVAASSLAGRGWGAIVSSPLVRATETARIVSEIANLPLLGEVHELIERDYGSAEGVGVADAADRWPSGNYPGGESIEALGARGAAVVARLVAEHPLDLVLVSHGAFIRATAGVLTGLEVARVRNGEVIELERIASGWRLAPDSRLGWDIRGLATSR